ncbi:WD domain, G-beta repeat protein [Necator americanus]|uniref:Pre-mRNA-processing factor 17 n=1 Tax=Necator americanus TaxID=51031 RepID=W2THN0_NECAM|nr:WD domain, G-beta repeat protein [Necator americanus]ETN81303.1 WD domain, G-beta repeat protein [Necator americanus]
MDLLKGYAHSDEEMSDDDATVPVSSENCMSLALPASLAVAPEVNTKSILKQIAIVDPKTKELKTNPTYEQLFQPEAGPSNPFKSENQKAQKNTLTGFVEPAHINEFHFTRELRSFDTLGYARNPTAEQSNEFIGNKEVAIKSQGESLFDSKKTGGEKRKRQANFDSSDVEGYTGPWAKYCDEQTIAKPDPELQKEMDEIVRKRQANSRRFKRKQQQQENDNAEETSVLHLKEAQDYQGRSFLVPPAFTGVNLRADAVPEKCFIPKKQIHVYKGHTKGVNCVQWFPKSAHLFLSCSMDTKIKLWEVYGKHQVVRTYAGHRLPVREVTFNNEGTEFLSASFDRYVKLWDTETGQVKQRFHTGHIPFCVKFHPDDDKNHMFLAGMQNKKIVQWDSRTGEIVQEYDRHLGAVNSITFFDKNRRFASTSDDKSIRIWEWEIPVDTKLIQNVGLHSIPTMNKSPNEKWVVGQSMDNRIVLFQLIDEKLRFAKKKAFRGHNSAGYACVTDFSPDMSFLISGDADGKLFIWDWRTHKIVARWKAHDSTCISARWHPHEKSKILTAGWDTVIKMWA